MICAHAKTCSVCHWIDVPYADQRVRKTALLRDQLVAHGIAVAGVEAVAEVGESIAYFEVAEAGLRDRADLVFENGRLGFYQQSQRQAFQLESCPLMSPALNDFFQDFRRISFPIRKGSLRLRISPSTGLRGMWLDFANEDIRDLLNERVVLSKLLELGVVEIGQRRKYLSPADFKLKDPEFHPWSRTWVLDDPASAVESSSEVEPSAVLDSSLLSSQSLPLTPIDLQSVVGGFTQSGDAANRVLVSVMQRYFRASSSQEWVEFGSGNGNLTLALAGSGLEVRVKALEFDVVASAGLQRTLEMNPKFASRIKLRTGDFQRRDVYQFRHDEAVLVNPPRSGLMKFLDPLFEIPISQRPRDFLYMSCHLDSFITDSIRLKQLGYGLLEISIVDQFPHSPHFEILSRWSLA